MLNLFHITGHVCWMTFFQKGHYTSVVVASCFTYCRSRYSFRLKKLSANVYFSVDL